MLQQNRESQKDEKLTKLFLQETDIEGVRLDVELHRDLDIGDVVQRIVRVRYAEDETLWLVTFDSTRIDHIFINYIHRGVVSFDALRRGSQFYSVFMNKFNRLLRGKV